MAIGDKVKKALEEKAAAQAEAATETTPDVEATPEIDGAAALANAIVNAINQNQPKRVQYGRHKLTSAFDNPDGSPKPKLTRKYFQNGRLIQDHTVKSLEIELLNRLRPGRFVDGLISVVVSPDGGTVNIVYKCKTADQRMAIGARVGSFKGMLKRLIRESIAQEEAEKARIRELARSKPRTITPDDDLLKDDEEDLRGDEDDDEFDV